MSAFRGQSTMSQTSCFSVWDSSLFLITFAMQNPQWKSNNDILKNFSSPEKMSRQVWSLFIQAFYGFAVTNLKLYRLNLSSQEYSISFIIFYFTVRNNVCPTVTCPSNCQYGYDRTPAQNGCPQCKCGKYNLRTS